MNIVLAMAQGLVVMLVAPFFSGLARVIRAKMHNRRGPSILQDYRDLAKLMARPESVSSDSSFVLRIMPPLFLAVSFMLAMGLPMFTLESPMPVFGDAITIMYALALSRFFFALSGVDSSNAYAGFGGIRELLMSVLIEPSMLIALFTVAIVCGSTDIATMGQHIVTGNVSSVVAVILSLIHIWVWVGGVVAVQSVITSVRDAFFAGAWLPFDALPLADIGAAWAPVAVVAFVIGLLHSRFVAHSRS